MSNYSAVYGVGIYDNSQYDIITSPKKPILIDVDSIPYKPRLFFDNINPNKPKIISAENRGWLHL